MIHIGIDAWNIPGDRRGIGRYVRKILAAWAASASERVRVTLIVPERWPRLAAARYRTALDGRPYLLRSRSTLQASDFDVLWFPFNGPSWNDRFPGPAVATLHDASTFVLPGFSDDARATFRLAAERCEHFLTVSTFSASELQRELALDAQTISIVPLGVATPLPLQATRIDPARYGRFVLYVGGTEPRKNLATVIAALRRLRNDPPVTLVLIGPQTFALPEHADLRVAALGEVDESTLAAFYRRCTVFVYASLYEGFGLPILEAMSYGAPVVAARSSALAETGGAAAIYVDPLDAAGFAAAIEQIVNDERLSAELGARGRARAAELSWERTANATLAVFEGVVAGTAA